MNKSRLVRELTACTLAAAVVGATPAALADDDTPRRGMMGPGMMMDGNGPYGPGYGQGMHGGGPCVYGPGAMHGSGQGMMMPGYRMMGPGYSMGPGMMGPGYGYGPMMGGYGWGSSNMGRLTEQKAERLREIQQERWQQHAELMEQMHERQRELYRMQLADDPDYEAIKKKSREIGKLQQEMALHRIEAHQQMQEALEAE